MTNRNQQNSNSEPLPFFVRYLENQSCEDLSIEEMKQIEGGMSIQEELNKLLEQGKNPVAIYNPPRAQTNAYPSDTAIAYYPDTKLDWNPSLFW